jgi:hypothetical protein
MLSVVGICMDLKVVFLTSIDTASDITHCLYNKVFLRI